MNLSLLRQHMIEFCIQSPHVWHLVQLFCSQNFSSSRYASFSIWETSSTSPCDLVRSFWISSSLMQSIYVFLSIRRVCLSPYWNFMPTTMNLISNFQVYPSTLGSPTSWDSLYKSFFSSPSFIKPKLCSSLENFIVKWRHNWSMIWANHSKVFHMWTREYIMHIMLIIVTQCSV